MTLSNDEYKIEGNGIWISKDALESWRKHYTLVAEHKKDCLLQGLYLGKADVLIDLLKMFEPLEG